MSGYAVYVMSRHVFSCPVATVLCFLLPGAEMLCKICRILLLYVTVTLLMGLQAPHQALSNLICATAGLSPPTPQLVLSSCQQSNVVSGCFYCIHVSVASNC